MNKQQERLLSKTAGISRAKEDPSTPQAETGTVGPVAVAPGATTPGPEASPKPVRTSATMPGQLGAFRVDAQRYVDTIDALRAEVAELKVAGDRVQRLRLTDVIDSPYQPRLAYDPEEIDALAKTMAIAKQADPIKVRKKGDKYELIGGHRRKRAAISLGWTEIDAIVEERTDEQAELEAMLLVVANAELSDFELAVMYRRAIAQGFCKTQSELANMLGSTQSQVSARLDLLKLPEPILTMLEARPSLFGFNTGNVIKALLKEYPQHEDIVVQGVRRLAEENAAKNLLKSWVLQAIAQKRRKSAPVLDTRTITRDGHEVFRTKKGAKSVTVSIQANNVDHAKFEGDLHQWLKDYASSIPK